ncbi:MAG: N-formylglutamate amidohydrolase [Chryseolinea sp.]
MDKYALIITCEHAGNTVPDAYNHLFKGADDVLNSHRGWDPGAIETAQTISDKLQVPFFKCQATRLLVEANRSLFSTSLFSEYSGALTIDEREEVLNQYYYPHRSSVEHWISEATMPVLHISMHTFTPVFQNITRTVDIGLLFDPSRVNESIFCRKCNVVLTDRLPDLSIKFNEPYRGIDDGFTSYLRTIFPDERYSGVEIEVSQKFNGTDTREEIALALTDSLTNFLK